MAACRTAVSAWRRPAPEHGRVSSLGRDTRRRSGRLSSPPRAFIGRSAGGLASRPSVTRLPSPRSPVTRRSWLSSGSPERSRSSRAPSHWRSCSRGGGALHAGTPLLAGWGASALFLVYGAANLVQDGLIVLGAIPVPVGLGAAAARWRLFLWDPWWLLGGVLFALAAWSYRRRLTTSA